MFDEYRANRSKWPAGNKLLKWLESTGISSGFLFFRNISCSYGGFLAANAIIARYNDEGRYLRNSFYGANAYAPITAFFVFQCA